MALKALVILLFIVQGTLCAPLGEDGSHSEEHISESEEQVEMEDSLEKKPVRGKDEHKTDHSNNDDMGNIDIDEIMSKILALLAKEGIQMEKTDLQGTFQEIIKSHPKFLEFLTKMLKDGSSSGNKIEKIIVEMANNGASLGGDSVKNIMSMLTALGQNGMKVQYSDLGVGNPVGRLMQHGSNAINRVIDLGANTASLVPEIGMKAVKGMADTAKGVVNSLGNMGAIGSTSLGDMANSARKMLQAGIDFKAKEVETAMDLGSAGLNLGLSGLGRIADIGRNVLGSGSDTSGMKLEYSNGRGVGSDGTGGSGSYHYSPEGLGSLGSILERGLKAAELGGNAANGISDTGKDTLASIGNLFSIGSRMISGNGVPSVGGSSYGLSMQGTEPGNGGGLTEMARGLLQRSSYSPGGLTDMARGMLDSAYRPGGMNLEYSTGSGSGNSRGEPGGSYNMDFKSVNSGIGENVASGLGGVAKMAGGLMQSVGNMGSSALERMSNDPLGMVRQGLKIGIQGAKSGMEGVGQLADMGRSAVGDMGRSAVGSMSQLADMGRSAVGDMGRSAVGSMSEPTGMHLEYSTSSGNGLSGTGRGSSGSTGLSLDGLRKMVQHGVNAGKNMMDVGGNAVNTGITVGEKAADGALKMAKGAAHSVSDMVRSGSNALGNVVSSAQKMAGEGAKMAGEGAKMGLDMARGAGNMMSGMISSGADMAAEGLKRGADMGSKLANGGAEMAANAMGSMMGEASGSMTGSGGGSVSYSREVERRSHGGYGGSGMGAGSYSGSLGGSLRMPSVSFSMGG